METNTGFRATFVRSVGALLYEDPLIFLTLVTRTNTDKTNVCLFQSGFYVRKLTKCFSCPISILLIRIFSAELFKPEFNKI